MKTNALMEKKEPSIGSVFEDFWILVFCCQFQFLLPLHVAVPSHCTQVASVQGQQHHGGRKGSIANISQALSSDHSEDPGRERGTWTAEQSTTIHILGLCKVETMTLI